MLVDKRLVTLTPVDNGSDPSSTTQLCPNLPAMLA